MINIEDQLNYLYHCQKKMRLAITDKRWSDAAEFAKAAALTLEGLAREFTVEAANA